MNTDEDWHPKKMTIDKGIDAEGFILNPCSGTHVPAAYRPLLDATREKVVGLFPELHSVYIYGSVGRGDAIPGKSDLDLVTIFHRQPSESDQARLRKLSQQLAKEYPVAIKVDFDIGFVEEILGACQELHWQFFLKHCCSCLWGADLSKGFSKQKPSKALGYRLNADLSGKIQSLLTDMNEENAASRGKTLAKQLIRSAYFLAMERDGSFYNKINDCAAAFLKHHPDKKDDIGDALAFLSDDKASVAEVQALAKSFGRWVVENSKP